MADVSDDGAFVVAGRGREFRLGSLYDYRIDRITHQSLENPLLFKVDQLTSSGHVIKFTPIGSIFFKNQQDIDLCTNGSACNKISIGKIPEQVDSWTFFQGTPAQHGLLEPQSPPLKWHVDRFLWDDNRALDGLDRHSKVSCLLLNPPNLNQLWSHEIDTASQVAAVLTLHCQTLKFELTATDALTRVIHEVSATHLVSAVQYGVQVSCVFQRHLRKGEAIQDAQSEMASFISEVSTALTVSDKALDFKQQYDIAVTIYGMNENVKRLNCSETLQLLKSLVRNQSPDGLKRHSEQLRVWLTPLHQQTNETLRDLSDDDFKLWRNYCNRIDSLRAQAGTLLDTNGGVKHFTYVRPLLHEYRKTLDDNKSAFRNELHHAVIELRNNSNKSTAVEISRRIARDGEAFYEASKEWLEYFKSEVRVLSTIACHAEELSIPLAHDEDDIYRYLTNVAYEYVVVFVLPPISSSTHYTKERSPQRRAEFYRKARQFFKNASQRSQPKTAFLMTAVAFQTGTSDAAKVTVFRNGALVSDDGDAWLTKWQSKLSSQLQNDDATSQHGRHPDDDDVFDLNGSLSASIGNKASSMLGKMKSQRENEFTDDGENSQLQHSSESLNRTRDSSTSEPPPHHVTGSTEHFSSANSLASFDAPSGNRNGASNQTGGNRLSLMSTASQESVAASQVSASSEVLKQSIREKSVLLKNGNDGNSDSYALPMASQPPPENSANKVRRYAFNDTAEFGENDSMHHRTILLVGAADSGKTSLINSMINYVFDVKRDDNFRFEVPNPQEKQASITTYEINHVQGMQVPFSLTLIDTPGYRGKQGADENVTESIRQFLKEDNGVQVVDAVCFVCSTDPNSSSKNDQEYALHSMQSVFGKDVKGNIHVFFTFTDSKPLQVPDVVRKVKSAFEKLRKEPKHYLISNLALHRSDDDSLPDLWSSSRTSLEEFFDSLILVQSKSLVLTQRVLDERKRLEKILEMLRPKISAGLSKMEELQKHRSVLSEHKASADNHQETYEIQVAVLKKVDISGKNEHLTNCQICQTTCHYPCAFREDQDKRRCTAIDGKTGNCRVCANKCHWSVHFNQTFRWEYAFETSQGTVDSLREKYDATATLATVQIVQKLENEFKAIAEDVLSLVAKAAGCIQRLEQMALFYSPCTTSSYILKMIDSERQQKTLGYEQRIANLRNVLELAQLSDRIHRNEPLLPQSPHD